MAAIAERELLVLTDWSRRGDLTLVGASLEVAGIALLGVDLYWPTLAMLSRRLAGYSRLQLDKARTRLRRLLRHPITATASSGGAYVDNLDERAGLQASSLRADMTALESRLRDATNEAIKRSRDQFLPLRLLGFAVALAGAIVLALSNVA